MTDLAIRPARSAASEGRRWLGLFVLCAALALDSMGIAVVNTAAPSIGAALHLSASTLQWVISAYAVTYAGFLLLGGRAGDLFGRRRLFISGFVLFGLGALAAALLPGGTFLIVARGLMGIGAALSAPTALSLISQLFPSGPERAKALGVFTSVGSSSFSVGLVFGGVLTDTLGWRSVFLVNLPLIALVVAGALRFLPAGASVRTGRLDAVGALTVTSGLVALVFGVTEAQAAGWTWPTVVSLVAAAGLLAGFVVRQARADDPLLPLRVFRSRSVVTATVVGFAFFTTVIAHFFFAALYLQNQLHYSPIFSALAFVPMGIVVAISSNVAGRLLPRFGMRPLLVAGMILVAAGVSTWLGIGAHTGYLTGLLPGILVMSVGQGVTFTAMTAAGLDGVAPELHGVAGGLNVTAQQVGTGLGTALLVALASARTASLGAGPAAVIDGYRWGIGAAVLVAVLGAVAAAVLLRRTR